MDRRTLIVSVCALPVAASAPTWAAASANREPVIGGPCEGCDWVYDDMPSKLASIARIAPKSEAGVPLVIDGIVKDSHGAPSANVIVYAYHTNVAGIYPPARNRHGTMKGWALTDAQGRYRFDSMRPGAYPGRTVPEHVHMHVIEPRTGTYYIDELRFLDDPLVTAANRGTRERAGSGLVMPERRDGVWHARRDIELGRNIPGYPG